MGDAVGVFLALITAMAVLGTAGRYIAKDRNRNPLVGFAVGALIPVVGIGLLMMLNRKPKN